MGQGKICLMTEVELAQLSSIREQELQCTMNVSWMIPMIDDRVVNEPDELSNGVVIFPTLRE